jgi:hypothetical protein
LLLTSTSIFAKLNFYKYKPVTYPAYTKSAE